MKKMKGFAAMVPPPPYEDPRAFRHHSLMHDYLELQKETEGVTETLVRAKHKKLTLLSEVRFLRRRYKYLMKKQSSSPQRNGGLMQPQKPEIRSRNNVKERNYSAREATLQRLALGIDLNKKGKVYNGKQAAMCFPSSGSDPNKARICSGKDGALRNSAPVIDLNVREMTYNGKEADMLKTTPAFDLNQISREEEEALNGGALRYEEPRKSSMRIVSEEQQNDMKLQVCRNVGNGNSRAGKRKITWQDQVALRV